MPALGMERVHAGRVRPHSRLPLGHRGWQWLARQAFRWTIPNRHWHLADVPGAQAFAAVSREGMPIRGWWTCPPQPRGTVLIAHGVTRNCTLDGIPAWGSILHRADMAVVAIDFRGHGRSGNGLITLGRGESLDIRGALDACVAQGLPGPYLVIGGSLGALAAQRAAVEDPRIAGIVLISMPAWPWQGIRMGGAAIAELIEFELKRRLPRYIGLALAAWARAIGRVSRVVAVLINGAYGYDILRDGDIRVLPRPPHTQVLCITGDRDTYDWRLTLHVWRLWCRGRSCQAGLTPAQAPAQGAWFLLARGYHHPPVEPHVLQWRRLLPALLEFIDIVTGRPATTTEEVGTTRRLRRRSASDPGGAPAS